MRAQVVRELGGIESLRLVEVESPDVPAGHIKIEVEAVGLNFPDLLMIQGLYQFKPDLPFSPGAEACGRIIDVGDGVTDLVVGDRVMAVNLAGAMAEHFVAPEYNTFRIPDNLTADRAAALSMTYGTTYHALVDRSHLAEGETLLVTGASGGVGSAAIQIGKALGAQVIAGVSTDAKAEVAASLGADETVNYESGSLKDQVKELTGGKGADVIYEPVGGDVFLQTLRCIAWEGRILVVGFASGEIPSAPMNLPLLKGCSIVGVFWGGFARRNPVKNRANFAQILTWAADGTIDPHISATYPFEEAKTALTQLANRTATGKVVLLL
ncbi:MAG TPA: NADPH:quinone oxidoreductase family protein [Actinobacteria bacterium]|nr:NADPH:quinone oxidoreductase family protein [Actinomycetota bacterium]